MRRLTAPLPRSRTLLRAGALALCLAAGTVLAACGGTSAPAAPSANEGLILNHPTPNHVPLENQYGKTVSLAGLKGKVVVLAPFLTLCQDECPLVTAAFIGLQRDVKAAGLGSKVVFIEATVDPGRDTVTRLAAYQREFGADWDLWTGTKANLATFWKAFGVSYQIVPEEQPPHTDWLTGQPLTYDVNHTDGYILINAQGNERFVDSNAPNLHGQLSPKLTSLLNAGGVQGLHHPQPLDWSVNQALAAISWLVGTHIPVAG